MPRCAQLLAAARENPQGLRFLELRVLAECHGWVFFRQNGSHLIYKKPNHPKLLSIQRQENGNAKGYQVRQLLAAIETEGQEKEE